MAYKIKVDAVAVPRALFEYEDEEGNINYHHTSTVRVKDEVVQDDELSPLIHQLYKDGDESVRAVYEKVADDHYVDKPPFADYEKLDDFEVRVRMQTMSSQDIANVKAYERDHQNRESIVEYVTGYGESPVDRINDSVVGQSAYVEPEQGNKAEEVIKPKRASTKKTTDAPKAPPKSAKRTSVKKQQSSEE